MNFGEMIDQVINVTKRPDKRDNIKDAINSAISFFTLSASFAADLVETTVTIDADDYAQSFSITDSLTRFRRLEYVKRTGQRGTFDPIDPNNAFDKNECERTDVYYRAGDNIVVRLKTLSETLEVGYYQYPEFLTDDADMHWMMDASPIMVKHKACAEIFADIGEPADAKLYESKAMGLYLISKVDMETGTTAKAQ